jgi:hypothetical protein
MRKSSLGIGFLQLNYTKFMTFSQLNKRLRLLHSACFFMLFYQDLRFTETQIGFGIAKEMILCYHYILVK